MRSYGQWPLGPVLKLGSSQPAEKQGGAGAAGVVDTGVVLYTLGLLTISQLRELVSLEDRGVVPALFDARAVGELTQNDQQALAVLRRNILSYRPLLANEATLWARMIYPLLLLGERDNIRAFSLVPLSATLPRGELRGEVDGALAAMDIEADAMPPYLLVVEAKRGVEARSPVAQLLGGLLCAAWHNQQKRQQTQQVLYGAYTVADVWTFLQVTLTDLIGEQPRMRIVSSREYTETGEAATIVLLLKSMVSELLQSLAA